MNYEDIKRHFEAFPPPHEVDWKPWAKITDTQLFLKSCYIGIRNFNGPVERCPAWWHLKDFYLLIKRTVAQQTAPSEQPAAVSIEEGDSEALGDPAEKAEQESVEA